MRWVIAGLMLLAGTLAADELLIENARLLPAVSDPGEVTTLLLRDGRLFEIGAGIEVSEDVNRLDAGGRWLTTGLVAAYSRLGLTEISSATDTVDTSAAASDLGAEFDPSSAFNANAIAVVQSRADGLSHAVLVPQASGRTPWQGQVTSVELGPPGTPVVATVLAVAARMTGGDFSAAGQSRAVGWQRIRRDLEAAADPGDDVHLQALAPVAAGRLALLIETHREADLRQALALAEELDLRLVLAGAAEAWRLADELAARNVAVILDPALNLPMDLDRIGATADNARLLLAAGVEVAFMDSSAQMNHDTALMLRQAAGLAWATGVGREAAWAAVTSTPAGIWALADATGTLQPGAPASLVLWDGDPLEPSSAPWRVIQDGQVIAPRTRQQQLRDRYRAHRP